ncbi:MAG: VOC family protein [Anaerolineae bacterium]
MGACLFAEDMDGMVRFYRDTLGFHTQWNGGDFAEFETASGALSLFMYSRKRVWNKPGEGGSHCTCGAV